ncbi:MAG: hypothetical protein JXR84_05865 [Anaerolineae bacterium]|nr:hypothetical protein [Anaerolineae bacterium]
MSSTADRALLILRFMAENEYILSNSVKRQAIVEKLKLPEQEFQKAYLYLLQSDYLKGTMGGMDGKTWLTTVGLNFLESEMEKRIPLSLLAERILCLAVEMENKDPQTEFVGGKEMWDQLEITFDEYCRATLELGDEGFIESRIPGEKTPFLGFHVTAAGRNALRRGLKRQVPVSPSQINIGAYFNGPVSDTNILAVAQAHHSKIEQAISQNDTTSLRAEIEQLLQDLVKTVQPELSLPQYAAYVDAAQQLQQETRKDQPDPTLLHKLLSTLEFAATIDGAVEFGRKALDLYIKLAPLLMPLYQAIIALLN